MSVQAFELILISPPEEYPQETQWVNQLFANGLDTFHLRKPGWTSGRLIQYLEKIDVQYHSRIMVHYQQEVIRGLAIKGIHFRYNELPLQKSPYKVSCGIHSWNEFLEAEGRFDYAFVSPFFDSISKEGYSSNQTLWNIPDGVDRKRVIALGGVEAGNMDKIKRLELKGAAVLGAVWNEADPLEAFLYLNELR